MTQTYVYTTQDEAQQLWIEYAKDVVTQYAADHPLDLFTTKEIWPHLINPPGDRRAMGAVMRTCVRNDVIYRSTLVPDPGEATTKNGITFPFNKPVWAYRSTKHRVKI